MVGSGGTRVGRGGKIVGSGPIVGMGTTGVLLGGLVGCAGVFVGGGSGVLGRKYRRRKTSSIGEYTGE